MILEGQPGKIFVVRDRQYELAQADDDGVVRDEDGRSLGHTYDIVHRIYECEACAADDLENFTLVEGTDELVCQECGHR